MTTTVLARFERYIDELTANLSGRPEVLGLVLMGSGADRSRVDEWCDIVFAVITATGEEAEALRGNLDWLPGHENIVLSVRETHDGLKAMYADGRILEFGVTTLTDLGNWHANSYEVAFDRGGVAERMSQVASREKPGDHVDDGRDIRLFVSLVLIAVGRARRGELLVAGQCVRSHALQHLLPVWWHRLPAPEASRRDNLDPFRRFEFVYPEAGPAMAAALASEPEAAARALLDLAEKYLAPGWPEWPRDAVTAVRERLGW